MIQTEFTLKNREFRVNMSSIDMLSLSYCMDFDDVAKTSKMLSFILEHIEVKIGNTWSSVKVKGRDEYFPVDIEKDLDFLKEIAMYFITEVLMPLFQKSN